MSETHYFATDAAIIGRLGRELVARQETALIELVKNAFDADATNVEVRFTNDGALEISDDGVGMNREALLNGFMRLASDFKVKEPVSSKYKRRRAGRKGIGRFATQRLGDRLVLETCAAGSIGLRLIVDWTDFEVGKDLDQVAVGVDEMSIDTIGTTLRIEGLSDEWTDAQIKRSWRGVLALQQPFPVAKVESAPSADPGFDVKFLRADVLFGDESTVADFQTEILDHLHAIIEFRVDAVGKAEWRMPSNRFGAPRSWKSIHHDFPDLNPPPLYAHLRNAAMKAYYVILDPELLPSLVFTRIRDVLADQGGIRLYRNGFRVIPYGDPGNDWLQLDEVSSKRVFLAPIANRNFFGVIELTDVSGRLFEEHTSREGLIENPAFAELKGLSSAVLLSAATSIAEDRGKKVRSGTPRLREVVPPSNTSALQEIGNVLKATQDAALRAASTQSSEAANLVVAQVREASRLLEEKKLEIESVQARLADETAMLRLLATLGMTTAEFSHETGMTFDAFRLDFKAVFDAARAASKEDEILLSQADRAAGMLARLDTLTSYLNSLAAARAARGMRAISLSKAVLDFQRAVVGQAKTQGVDLKVDVPSYDPLFTTPMHEAEVASILLNLYTNAIKAIKRSKLERRILVRADRLIEEERVRIRFYDSGDGVSSANADKIFDAFFTTQNSPAASSRDAELATGTGLGLWIVRQILDNADGEIAVTSPSDSYSTCFELLFSSEKD